MSHLLLGLKGVQTFVKKARTNSANRRLKEEASVRKCRHVTYLRRCGAIFFWLAHRSSLLVDPDDSPLAYYTSSNSPCV